MLKAIGSALGFAIVTAALSAVVLATFSREVAPLEGLMLWKAGLLGMVFFAVRMYEAAVPATVSILNNRYET